MNSRTITKVSITNTVTMKELFNLFESLDSFVLEQVLAVADVILRERNENQNTFITPKLQ